MFLAYLHQPREAVRVSGSEVEAFDQGRVMSANFNLVGCAKQIEDLIKGKLDEARAGFPTLVCIIGEDWGNWIDSPFMRSTVTELQQSLAKGTIKFKDKTEPVRPDLLSELSTSAGNWACMTWSLTRQDTFLTTDSSCTFSLVCIASLPLLDTKSAYSNLEQFKGAVNTVTRRRLICVEKAQSASIVFNPASLPQVLNSIITVGRMNRTFFTYKPTSASKLLAWKYRTQLSTLENITSAFSSGDLSSLNLSRLSIDNERLKDLASQISQPFATDFRTSSFYETNFEKYVIGYKKADVNKSQLPPRPKSRECNSRVVKYKGRMLRPATNYNKQRNASSKNLA